MDDLSLINPFSEASDGAGENHKTQHGKGHILGPEDMQTDPFQEYPPNDGEKLP